MSFCVSKKRQIENGKKFVRRLNIKSRKTYHTHIYEQGAAELKKDSHEEYNEREVRV